MTLDPELQPGEPEPRGEETKPIQEETWVLPGVYRTPQDAVTAAEEGKRKIGEQGQQLSALQQEVAQYRNYYEQLQAQQAAASAGTEGTEGEEEYLTPKTVKKLLQEEIGRALQPLTQQIGKTTLTATQQAIAADPDYPAIKDEFDNYIRLFPAQALADPEAIKMAYNAVKGQNFEKVYQARVARQMATKLPGDAVLGRVAGRSGSALETARPGLSNEQKRASAMLGVESEEDMSKWSDPNYYGEPAKGGS